MGEEVQATRCAFTITSKNRNCKFQAQSGSPYCGNHRLDVVRTACSFCNAQVKHYDRHIQRCPARRDATDDGFLACNINCTHEGRDKGAGDSLNSLQARSMTTSLEQSELDQRCRLMKLVNDAYESLSEDLRNPGVKEIVPANCAMLSNKDAGSARARHTQQQVAIIGQLQNANVLDHEFDDPLETAFLEFGCGRGYLSLLLAESRQFDTQATYVLVDRKSPRFRADRVLRERNAKFLRLRVDIADLRLEKIPEIRGRRLVGMSKHLCGSATDFTVRCALRATAQLHGLFIASCCRHRCEWESFLDQDFFLRRGISPADFSALARVTASSVSSGKKGFGRDTCENAAVDQQIDGVQRLPRDELMRFAERCRTLIDAARVLYLRSLGFNASLVRYVDASVTAENVMLCVQNPSVMHKRSHVSGQKA